MWYEEERDDITVEDMCKRYIQEYARDPVNGYKSWQETFWRRAGIEPIIGLRCSNSGQ